MAAKEQLTAMEMIWGFMSGTTGHMGKTDFAPQKEVNAMKTAVLCQIRKNFRMV